MRDLKDIVVESLLDDMDTIIGKAENRILNPFKVLACTPKSICDNDTEFKKALEHIELMIKSHSKIIDDFKKSKIHKYKIAFGYDSIMAPRLYLKLGPKYYMVRGQALGGKIQPYIMELDKVHGSIHFEKNPPYYIPNQKLIEQMDEFVTKYFEGRKDMNVWEKYINS